MRETILISRCVRVITVCMIIGVMEWGSVHDNVYEDFAESDMFEVLVIIFDDICDDEPSEVGDANYAEVH